MTATQTRSAEHAHTKASAPPRLTHKASFYATTVGVALTAVVSIGMTWLVYHV